MHKNWVVILFLIFFTAFLLLPGLSKSSLWDRDETFYAEVSREMLATKNYIIPRFNEIDFLEKPPFAYWIMAGSFRLFGVGEFSARFPSALFGIGTVLLTFFLGTFLFDRRTGIFSSLILSTSLFFLIAGKSAITDIYLLFFFTGSLLFFFLGSKRKYCYLVSYGLTGLAVLTKGPIGFLLPAAIIFLYLLFNKELRQIKDIHLPAGILLFFLVVSPWYLAIMKTTGGKFFSEFICRQHLYRFFHPMQGHYGPFYYYIPVLIFGFFPWSVFLPAAVWVKSEERREKSRAYFFLIIWMAAVFLFFSVSKTKLPHYILPLFPPSCILIGKFWSKEKKPFLKLSLFFFLGISILFFLSSVSLFWLKPDFTSPFITKGVADQRSDGVFAFSLLTINFALLVGGGLLSLSFLRRKRLKRVFISLVAIIFFFISFFSLSVVPEVNKLRAIPSLAKMAAKGSPEDLVLSFRWFEPSLVFYSRHRVQRVNSLSELEKSLKTERKIFCFIQEEDYREIKDKINLTLLAKKEGLSENKGRISLLLLTN
ncbi:MAG: hypothetical protein COS11_06025 [bacterium (Candidatus Ratteibacteria) CG01_land_8_20_14_3_00_40_19]|uniref:Glycosyltransferase RgtA/B/C/D-like domain-containing protein n=1 Tax=bacterium (Candidatus Ratteibacteria) CG01_land_8_20_14_3_00_40_19 TaxID=2014290 RepID=A0A2M7E7I5_9BACT|nr:MAG: hypothetical protein AUJ76_00560 [Candidatus Omnitrophica bacterium CG1_02_41_171]PIV63702.1 MAG: hypothetical protein COS11_06025 [bacterium (Candidatus Ratteibacteria) CG01_land_8_20_14_3_00_40_19]PIW73725.1 MAG: hypothetical protein CO004_04475 [bacterium (Candidatus Ratteibacteria) CG_4_8_14_3_um_filter_41_36]HCG77307.1 hypothetical protein [bacterium]